MIAYINITPKLLQCAFLIKSTVLIFTTIQTDSAVILRVVLISDKPRLILLQIFVTIEVILIENQDRLTRKNEKRCARTDLWSPSVLARSCGVWRFTILSTLHNDPRWVFHSVRASLYLPRLTLFIIINGVRPGECVAAVYSCLAPAISTYGTGIRSRVMPWRARSPPVIKQFPRAIEHARN